MSWRSVLITQPGYLKLKDRALTVEQAGEEVRVPLEDISVILLDNPQITLTAPLLSACAEQQVAVISTGPDHHPNGVFLPFLPHSRGLQILRLQLEQSQPKKKRLWQVLVQQKIRNQAAVLVLKNNHDTARKLERMAARVRSGDSTRQEALAAQLYFPALFGRGFSRQQKVRINALLNYGYAVIRALLAKYLVSYGFLTALGLHHSNERNAFNLVDDLIEPFRPLLDLHCLQMLANDCGTEDLEPQDKSLLVGFVHQDIITVDQDGELTERSLMAACESIVISLQQRLRDGGMGMNLPVLVV